jgi:hypothetical protein
VIAKAPKVGHVVLALAIASAPSPAVAAPRRAPSAPKPLPAPPTLPLVRLEVASDHVLVLQDVVLRRGDWAGGDLDVYVAFGAPGVPRAIDAQLFAGADDDDVVPAQSPWTIPLERAFRRPGQARQLLGPAAMAGVVLHLRDPSLGRALSATGLARVRLRTLLDAPATDGDGGSEVVVRLGAHLGEPEPLGVIEVASVDKNAMVTRAAAAVCGPEAAPYPLSVVVRPAPRSDDGRSFGTIAPVLAVRHATDDLCVRYWLAPRA